MHKTDTCSKVSLSSSDFKSIKYCLCCPMCSCSKAINHWWCKEQKFCEPCKLIVRRLCVTLMDPATLKGTKPEKKSLEGQEDDCFSYTINYILFTLKGEAAWGFRFPCPLPCRGTAVNFWRLFIGLAGLHLFSFLFSNLRFLSYHFPSCGWRFIFAWLVFFCFVFVFCFVFYFAESWWLVGWWMNLLFSGALLVSEGSQLVDPQKTVCSCPAQVDQCSLVANWEKTTPHI